MLEVLVLSFGWLPGEREEDRKKAAETSDATREVTMDEGKTDETAIDEWKKETDAIAKDNAVIETDAVTNEATSRKKDVVMSEVTDEAIKETNAVMNEATDEATKATDALVASKEEDVTRMSPEEQGHSHQMEQEWEEPQPSWTGENWRNRDETPIQWVTDNRWNNRDNSGWNASQWRGVGDRPEDDGGDRRRRRTSREDDRYGP